MCAYRTNLQIRLAALTPLYRNLFVHLNFFSARKINSILERKLCFPAEIFAFLAT